MLLTPVVVQVAAVTGFMAAAIAVGGFLAHAREAMTGGSEEDLRRLTAIGGLYGLVAVAVTLMVGVLL
ncbi:MAG TPA: hypothetical protein VHI77_04725 [Solirubrobacterales bacterium]|jgi:hypothetical protein|nr:hypothetical protein [Solirubrobacterales bacterium]